MAKYKRYPVNFDNTDGSFPKVGGPDAIIKNGSRFLFDFRRKACWPSQTVPANGATITNLVKNSDGSDAPAATISGSGIGFANGGFVFPGTVNNFINLGASYDFSAITNPAFLIIIWVKIDSTKTDAYQQIIGKGNNTNATNPSAAQYSIDSGIAGGTRPRGLVTSSAASPIATIQTDVALNTPVQIAMAFEANKVSIYYNGVLSQLAGTTVSTNLTAQALNTTIGQGGQSVWKGAVYRAYMEDLKTSGKTALEVIAADYNANKTSIGI